YGVVRVGSALGMGNRLDFSRSRPSRGRAGGALAPSDAAPLKSRLRSPTAREERSADARRLSKGAHPASWPPARLEAAEPVTSGISADDTAHGSSASKSRFASHGARPRRPACLLRGRTYLLESHPAAKRERTMAREFSDVARTAFRARFTEDHA